jgi:hypothetical protein
VVVGNGLNAVLTERIRIGNLNINRLGYGAMRVSGMSLKTTNKLLLYCKEQLSLVLIL